MDLYINIYALYFRVSCAPEQLIAIILLNSVSSHIIALSLCYDKFVWCISFSRPLFSSEMALKKKFQYVIIRPQIQFQMSDDVFCCPFLSLSKLFLFLF